MINQFSRTELLIGKEGLQKLTSARVAVFGIGGVGGYTVEALARSGIGALDLIDDDKICLTNINRQIFATHETVGEYKVDTAEKRIKQINPDCIVRTYKCFYLPENSAQFDFGAYSYVIDAIDTVTGKMEIIKKARDAGIPVISCMGAGNKMDASAFRVADIYDTAMCPLAKTMRKLCKENGIDRLKVVYSEEKAITPLSDCSGNCIENCICPPDTTRKCAARRQIPGSNAFVPAVAGMIMAGEVIKDLCQNK